MEAARPDCLDDAPFLAALGALLLEDGDIDQAVLWLERSLLLDADNLGAQADFAIALAARGETAPLHALSSAWAGRDDVPQALRSRLIATLAPADRYALQARRSGDLDARPQWKLQGEVSALLGHETNLNRSARLNELTLTIPGGSIVLPVDTVSRDGAALTSGLSYRVGYFSGRRWSWSTGISAASRNADRHETTNWQQYQWAASVVRHQDDWRAQLELSTVWVRGPLGEPLRQTRGAIGGEFALGTCQVWLGAETELRIQSDSTELDAVYRGGSLGTQCQLKTLDTRLGLSLRSGNDNPSDPTRPGGRQHVQGLVLRWGATPTPRLNLQAAARLTHSTDSDGYSPLLDDGAIRTMRLIQLTLEAAVPMPTQGMDLVLQLQSARQRSNLPLFSYRAHSAYSGLRYRW